MIAASAHTLRIATFTIAATTLIACAARAEVRIRQVIGSETLGSIGDMANTDQGIFIGSLRAVYRATPGGPHDYLSENTAMFYPEGNGNFAIEEGNVGFLSVSNLVGLFHPSGTQDFIAVGNTIAPGVGKLTDFSTTATDRPAVDGNRVAFWATYQETGTGTSRTGIFTGDGSSIEPIATQFTPIPGGAGNFTGFRRNPSFDDGRVAFGSGGGTYVHDGANIVKIVDTNTTIPGRSEKFRDSFNQILRGDEVVFNGINNSLQFRALYRQQLGGSLQVVADPTTDLPGTTESLFEPSSSSFDGQNVAFVGVLNSGARGIYLSHGGELTEILAPTPAAIGATEIFDLHISHDSLRANTILFAVEGRFPQGIQTRAYIATIVPEPAVLPLSALIGLAIFGNRKRSWALSAKCR